MPEKCCVYGCKANYDSEKNRGLPSVSVFRFPDNESDKQSWIDVIPNEDLRVTKRSVVCERHWPPNYPKMQVQGGNIRPTMPPSVWEGLGIPESCKRKIATPRRTKISKEGISNEKPDEMADFLALEKTTFSEIEEELIVKKRSLPFAYIAFVVNVIISIHSTEYACSKVHSKNFPKS